MRNRKSPVRVERPLPIDSLRHSSRPRTILHRLLLPAVVALTTAGPAAAGESAELSEVVVSASAIDDRFEAKRDEPASVSVIDGGTVDASHAQNIQQILQSIPGMTTDLLNGDIVKIKIRGVENQRGMGEKPGVAVVIDGVPVFEDSGRVNIDLDNIESIRVIKGGASWLYGEDALSGAVIITTKRGAGMAGVKLAAEAGSHGYEKQLVRAGHAGERFNTYVQATHRESDGWQARSNYETDYLTGKFQYYLDEVSDITFGVERSDRKRDEHGTVRGITQAKEDPRNLTATKGSYTRNYDVDLTRYHVTYARDFSDSKNLMLSAYQFEDETNYWSAPMSFDGDGNPVNSADLYQNINDGSQHQRGIKGEWRSGGERFAWLGGIDLRENRYEKTTHYLNDFRFSPAPPTRFAGTLTGDNVTDESIRAAYGEIKFQIAPRWVATLNGRYDRLEYDYKDHVGGSKLSRDFDVWSWRTGINHEMADNMDIFASAATGFRTPTVAQLFTGYEGLSGETSGNPDLDPEHSLNLEIGVRTRTTWFGRPVQAEASIFELRRRDFILSSVGQYANGADETFENIGGARNRGLELALNGEATDKISWNLSYTYLDAKFTRYDDFNLVRGNSRGTYQDSCATLAMPSRQWCTESYDNAGNRIPRSPRHMVNLSVETRPISGLKITGEVQGISSYYADELNRFRISGHALFNLLTSYDIKSGSGVTWNLFARIDNAFDRTYFTRAFAFNDTNQDGVYDGEDITFTVSPGRVWTAGLSVNF